MARGKAWRGFYTPPFVPSDAARRETTELRQVLKHLTDQDFHLQTDRIDRDKDPAGRREETRRYIDAVSAELERRRKR